MTLAATIPERNTTGIMFVFMAGVLWSTVGLGIRLIEDAVVWQILFYRSFGLAALLYLVIRLRSGQSPIKQAFAIGWPAIIGALCLVAAYAGGIYALQKTSVANTMLLFATAPFMTAILALVILKEPVRPHTWGAIALALIGVGIMVSDEGGVSSMAGNLAALGSALGFSIFTIALRWGRSGEMLPVVFLSGVFAIVIMGIICLGLSLPMILTPRDTGISLTMGIGQVGAGLVLYTLGSRTVPAAELTLLSLAEVVLAPLWVWLLLGEGVTPATLMGGSVLLMAITGNALWGVRRKPPVVTG